MRSEASRMVLYGGFTVLIFSGVVGHYEGSIITTLFILSELILIRGELQS